MDILVLSLVAGLVLAGGIWMATRDNNPVEKPPEEITPDRSREIIR